MIAFTQWLSNSIPDRIIAATDTMSTQVMESAAIARCVLIAHKNKCYVEGTGAIKIRHGLNVLALIYIGCVGCQSSSDRDSRLYNSTVCCRSVWLTGPLPSPQK